MSRNAKCRRVCAEFENRVFLPENVTPKEFSREQQLCRKFAKLKYLSRTGENEYVTVNVEELEALRLCDLEGLEQEEASRCMGISRGTLQRILYSARKKTAEALCRGKGVVIEGGNYEIAEKHCGCGRICQECPMESEELENER